MEDDERLTFEKSYLPVGLAEFLDITVRSKLKVFYTEYYPLLCSKRHEVRWGQKGPSERNETRLRSKASCWYKEKIKYIYASFSFFPLW